jgi:predicted nucleic acid-binding protein
VYIDSAIIVKLLVDEPDTDSLGHAIEGYPLATSELALPEVLSALLAKERNRLISTRQREEAWQYLLGKLQIGEIVLHPLDIITVKKAGQVLERCRPAVPLRTLDALHVAACDLTQDFPLCTTDKRMRSAARSLGIPVFPEEQVA